MIYSRYTNWIYLLRFSCIFSNIRFCNFSTSRLQVDLVTKSVVWLNARFAGHRHSAGKALDTPFCLGGAIYRCAYSECVPFSPPILLSADCPDMLSHEREKERVDLVQSGSLYRRLSGKYFMNFMNFHDDRHFWIFVEFHEMSCVLQLRAGLHRDEWFPRFDDLWVDRPVYPRNLERPLPAVGYSEAQAGVIRYSPRWAWWPNACIAFE